MGVSVDEFSFGPFRLDAAKRVLWRGAEVVALPPKAVSLLSTLVRAKGDVVSKEDLMARVWPDATVEDSNLTVTVSALRKALGQRGDGRPYIETLSRRGYRFLPPPDEGEERVPSLAVLPFRCPQGAVDPDGLGAAMAEAIGSRLAGTGRVRVRPPGAGAVLKFARRETDRRDGTNHQEADAVLEGEFERDHEHLRVRVRLVPRGAATPSWTASFDESFARLFRVQDALADQIATALDLELDTRARKALRKRPTENLEAWQAFARGAHFWQRLTPPSVFQAIACFEEALHHDPSYALAHVGRASGYLALAATGGLAPRHAWPLAAEAAHRAVALAPELAVAHLVHGYVKAFAEWDWTGAFAAMRRALARDPRSVSVHQWYAVFLCCMGRMEEAHPHTRQALAEDPVSLVGHALRGLRFTLARRHERALEEYKKVVELSPDHFLGHWGRGAALVRLPARADEGVASLRAASAVCGDNVVTSAFLAWGLALSGKTDEARALLLGLEGPGRGYVSPYQRAAVHLALGQPERALDLLEEAARDRDPWIALLRVDPRLDGLRGTKPFEELAQRVFARDKPAAKSESATVRPNTTTLSDVKLGGPPRGAVAALTTHAVPRGGERNPR